MKVVSRLCLVDTNSNFGQADVCTTKVEDRNNKSKLRQTAGYVTIYSLILIPLNRIPFLFSLYCAILFLESYPLKTNQRLESNSLFSNRHTKGRFVFLFGVNTKLTYWEILETRAHLRHTQFATSFVFEVTHCLCSLLFSYQIAAPFDIA